MASIIYAHQGGKEDFAKLASRDDEKLVGIESKPTLKEMLRERGKPITIEAPERPGEYLLEQLREAGQRVLEEVKDKFDLPKLSSKPPELWEDVKNLAAIQIIHGTEQIVRQQHEDEAIQLAPVSFTRVSHQRTQGVDEGFSETRALKGALVNIEKMESQTASIVASAYLSETLSQVTDMLQQEGVAEDDAIVFEDTMRAIITKSMSDKVAKLLGANDIPIRLGTDAGAEDLIDNAQSILKTLGSKGQKSEREQHLRDLHKETARMMLEIFFDSQHNLSEGSSSFTFDTRTADITRTVTSREYWENRVLVEDMATVGHVENYLDANLSHKPFVFAEKKTNGALDSRSVLTLERKPASDGGTGDIEAVGSETFKSNVIATIMWNVFESQEQGSGEVNAKLKKTVDGLFKEKNLPKIEAFVDRLMRVEDRFNARQLAGETNTDAPTISRETMLRVAEAVIAWDVMTTVSPEFLVEMHIPINAMSPASNEKMEPTRTDELVYLGESVKTLVYYLGKAQEDPNLWDNPKFGADFSCAAVNAAFALDETTRVYEEKHPKTGKGSELFYPPVPRMAQPKTKGFDKLAAQVDALFR